MSEIYLNAFLEYLSRHQKREDSRLPPLSEICKITKTSNPTLREQLEVARAFGFVEVKTKTGIRKNRYRFSPAVTASLSYAVKEDSRMFDKYADLRKHIESAYFEEAAALLEEYDINRLKELIVEARNKLTYRPLEIPFFEHRDFHMLMYSRLDNPFVTGLLEAYWLMYEETGLNRYTDLEYQMRVWNYHEKIVEAIQQGEISSSKKALLEHMILLKQRTPIKKPKHEFE